MALQAIRSLLLAMPEAVSYPDMRAFIDRSVAPSSLPCWDYAPLACAAVGAPPTAALPAAAAIFAQLAAIHLVDDLLDEDPRGLHHQIGVGRAANLALGFSAASHRALAEAELPAGVEAELQGRLAVMAMATAKAQAEDLASCADEEAYWRIVDMKTPPLFGCALALGARCGGATRELADAIAELGLPLGRLIQIGDDLGDALATPASPDWSRPRNNLVLHYALTAPHPQRERFAALVELVEASSDPEALREAQALVFACGAASYCVYRMLEARADARRRIDELALADASPLTQLLERLCAPVRGLLRQSGADPDEAIAAFEARSSR